jgi:hypothetical protein
MRPALKAIKDAVFVSWMHVTWGGVLHAAIKANVKWRATRWDYVAKRLTREVVTRWADTK